MRTQPVRELNPLFERELRGRWRKINATLLLLLPVLLEMVVLYFLLREPLQRSLKGIASVAELRTLGDQVLWRWRCYGGAVLVPLALFIGATSILHEKETGTLDQVLLSPLGPDGLVIGKVLSGAAYLLVIQLILLPLLLLSSSTWLLSPNLFIASAIIHFLLTVQALAMGVTAAVRCRDLSTAVFMSLFAWAGVLLVVAFAAALVGMILMALASVLNATFLSTISVLIRFVVPRAGVFLAGAFGVGTLLPGEYLRSGWDVLLLLCGQAAGLYGLSKFAGAMLKNAGPDLELKELHNFQVGAASSQLPTFVVTANGNTLVRQHPAVIPPQPSTNKNPHRLRLIPTRWVQNLNPVFWLDLQRCLSLRAPSPEAQVPLLLFFALGGSIAFAVGLATAVSWFQSIMTGNSADLAYLSDATDIFRIVLCYAALLVGPLFAAMGYVVERRSKMLHELRLTLLTAREMWWGKFGSRFVIPALAVIPALFIIGFVAQNSPDPHLQGAVLVTALMVLVVAAWSVLLCLMCSYHAPNQLSSALWCLALILLIAFLVWPAAMVLHPWLNSVSAPAAIRHAQWQLPFLSLYGTNATALGLYLWWRLRREGFV